MKTFLTTSLLILSLSLSAQLNTIDAIYNKYKNSPGITSISLNASFFRAMASLGNDKEMEELGNKLHHVRILVAEDEYAKDYNFTKEISKELKLSDYDELMRVDSSDEKVKILCKKNKAKYNEFLLLVEGRTDNAFIYISGDFKESDLGMMDSFIEVDQLSHLRKLEKE